MAGIPDKDMIELPGFPRGIDNLSEENAVSLQALREAVNVDLDGIGRPSRRDGYAQVKATPHHSLFKDGDDLYAVVEGTLSVYDAALVATPLVTNIGEAPVSYARAALGLYWTSHSINGMITPSGALLPFWPATPANPTVTVTATGGLAEGEYQVVVTVRDAYGRESGGSLAVLVSVPEGGGLQLANLPNLLDYSRTVVYVTPPGGEVFYEARVLTTSSPVIIGVGQRGRELGERQWWEPMPPGQAMIFAAGRLWVARGPYLYYSEPMAYGAMHPDNFIKFGDDITLLASAGEASDTGLYVGAGKRTLYLNGPDPKLMSMVIARPAGAVAGTALAIHTSAFAASLPDLPQTTAVLWLSKDGVFCLGLPGGSVRALTQRRMAATTDADAGAVMLRENQGANDFVASVQGGTSPRAAASDQIAGTVYRGGIEVN